MRLTASARAGLQEIVGGLLIALLTAAGAWAMIFLGRPKVVNIGFILLVIGEVIGLWMMLYGVLRLNRALKFDPEARSLPAAAAADAAGRLPHAQASALPRAPFSVTEGTTELLGAKPREREPVPAPRKGQSDTSPFG